jgi:hypothetical protein
MSNSLSIGILPISKIFKIIDSCTNSDQLDSCKKITNFYIDLIKKQGVVNPELARNTLNIKIQERRNEIEYAEENLK